MTLPTMDEIRRAHEAITRDGPKAPTTLELSSLVLLSPELRLCVDRLATIAADLAARGRLDAATGTAMITGAVVTGLNYALRIAEARGGSSGEPVKSN
jgi:hypothetical protein